MTARPLVQFLGVHKAYDGAPAIVRDLTLDIARHEVLTLLGPSGSGKTTTLMMLAGFEAPSAGRILLDGADLRGVPPHRRGFGVVFQNYALFPHLTVAENVAFPLAVRGMRRSDRAERVRRALDLVQLPGAGDRIPAKLSGGQQQRVALARALVFQPELILLDEPLGALDRGLREDLQAEIRALQARLGVTMLYVTHDQAEALTLSDRIAVFRHGVVQQVARPQTLYESPANEFVAGFVGENNRLRGEILDIEQGLVRIGLPGGGVVEARRGDSLGAGTACIVAIRPERIAIAPGPAEHLGDEAQPATVTDIVYLGDQIRVVLRLADGQVITVKRPVTLGVPGLTRGCAAAVAWSADHATAFGAPGPDPVQQPSQGHAGVADAKPLALEPGPH